MQALFAIALESVAETTGDPNSYGFRTKRSCADAISQCFVSLCLKTSAQWVFEADIKSCFDEISHDWIMDNIPMNKTVLIKWLKAGYIEKKRLFPTHKGTPQGGIISPMIMNMVLDGMETMIKTKFPRWKGKKVNFKSSVQSYKDKIKTLVKKNRGIPAYALIQILNPVIRGWSNYHKGICAKRTFDKLRVFNYWQLKRWAKHQHGNKNRCWIQSRYFEDNHFTDTRVSKNGLIYHRLYSISKVPIRYHIKIRSQANPFLPEFDGYFIKRKHWRENLAKECRQSTTFVRKDDTKLNSRVTRHGARLKSA